MSAPSRGPFDLMLVVDPRVEGVLEGLDRIGALVGGERVAVQLRAKEATSAERLGLARDLARVQPPMSRLIVNGDVELARAIAADGVHLPDGAMSAGEARAALAPGALVGASVHDARGVARRTAEGVDYLLLGPLGAVPGKPSIEASAFAAAARATGIAVLALGGIASDEDAERAIALGASGIALQRALVDPGAATWIARWLARRMAP